MQGTALEEPLVEDPGEVAAELQAQPCRYGLELWNAVKETPPSATKQVPKGGRKITAIDTYWKIRRATEEFGPVGVGWGWTYTIENVGDPTTSKEAMLVCHLRLWYVYPDHSSEGERTRVRSEYPVTSCIRWWLPRRNAEPVLDDEAPKKVLTDAITKGLSYLGFGADVFMGLFDDSRYVAEARAKEQAAAGRPEAEPIREAQPPESYNRYNGHRKQSTVRFELTEAHVEDALPKLDTELPAMMKKPIEDGYHTWLSLVEGKDDGTTGVATIGGDRYSYLEWALDKAMWCDPAETDRKEWREERALRRKQMQFVLSVIDYLNRKDEA